MYTQGSNKTFLAGAAITANSIVKLGGTDGKTVVLAAGATDLSIGTVQSATKINAPADVRLRSAAGTSQVMAGATITAGAPLTSDAAGQAVVATTAGQQLIGYALSAAATGKLVEFVTSTAKY